MSPTLSPTIPLALLPFVRLVIGYLVEVSEKLLQPLNEANATRVSDQTLPLPIHPLDRSAPDKRTSRSALPEEVLESLLSIAGLEVEPGPTSAPPVAEASAGETAAKSVRTASWEPSTVAVARALLEAFLAVLVIDASFFRVRKDFVSFGDVLEFF